MELNNKIYLINCDLGYKMFNRIEKDFPDRYYNVGASEQAGLDICVGLSYEGKIPFFYTITPFLLRGFETIRTYLVYEKLHCILVGSGRDKDYSIDGISHDATDIPRYLEALQGLKTYFPENKEEMPDILQKVLQIPLPSFISLKR